MQITRELEWPTAQMWEEMADPTDTRSFEDWCEHRKLQGPQFRYWHLVLTMELAILVFIRSLRESNFSLYRQLIPYMYANNNVNYAR